MELAILNRTTEMTEKMTDEIADLDGKLTAGFLAGAKQADVETLKNDLRTVRQEVKSKFQAINENLEQLLSAQKTSLEATAHFGRASDIPQQKIESLLLILGPSGMGSSRTSCRLSTMTRSLSVDFFHNYVGLMQFARRRLGLMQIMVYRGGTSVGQFVFFARQWGFWC